MQKEIKKEKRNEITLSYPAKAPAPSAAAAPAAERTLQRSNRCSNNHSSSHNFRNTRTVLFFSGIVKKKAFTKRNKLEVLGDQGPSPHCLAAAAAASERGRTGVPAAAAAAFG